MTQYRPLLGRVLLVLVMMAGAFLGAKLGLLDTREARASHNFSDVPDSAFYHDYVDFLVNNGITSGCQVSPPLYCPEQAVTRGQMAVFLEKANEVATGQPADSVTILAAYLASDGTL